jgi:hypothetical protein
LYTRDNRVKYFQSLVFTGHGLFLLPSDCRTITQFKVKVILLQTVSWPVYPDVRPPSGTRDRFYFIDILFKQLRVSYYDAPTLMRGWVCNLLVQLFLVFASAVTLGPKSRGTRGHNLRLIWSSHNL